MSDNLAAFNTDGTPRTPIFSPSHDGDSNSNGSQAPSSQEAEDQGHAGGQGQTVEAEAEEVQLEEAVTEDVQLEDARSEEAEAKYVLNVPADQGALVQSPFTNDRMLVIGQGKGGKRGGGDSMPTTRAAADQDGKFSS